MQEKEDLWTRPKWPSDPARSLKIEVLDLLRTLHLLGIKSATDNEFGHMIDPLLLERRKTFYIKPV
jgi:hypothetical protein